MKSLQSGFYWVNQRDAEGKPIDRPIIAEYDVDRWWVPGVEYEFVTDDFIVLSDRLQPPTKES